MNPLADIPLSVALSGMTVRSTLREQVEWAADIGFRAVQLNAAAQGARPRDLDRSARRDLAALLRRRELALSGVDLWLPPAHLTDPATTDRAVSAISEAVEFAAEMRDLAPGRAVVSVVLPPPGDPAGDAARRALREKAGRRAAWIADHRWPQFLKGEDAANSVGESVDSPIAVGLDPAAMFIAQGALADPGTEAARLASRVKSARLSDAASGERCPPGERGGRLDPVLYSVGLITGGYDGFLVLDLRGLAQQEAVARQVVARAERRDI